jgi:hypothetical protein
VNAAQAARGEHVDARAGGQVGGRGHRRAAIAAARRHRREVANAALRHVVALGDRPECLPIEPDTDLAFRHGDRRRLCAALTHRRLCLARHLEIAGPRQPVAHQRALERDDRPAAGKRLGYLRGDPHGRSLRRSSRP